MSMKYELNGGWVLWGLLVLFTLSSPALSDTVAYWRFETGPADAPVPTITEGYTFDPSVPDASGNGNALDPWTGNPDNNWAGFFYRTDVPGTPIQQTGAANNFSIQNAGSWPAAFTDPAGPMTSWEPAAWTIEVSFKPENGGYRTLVGRDAQGVATQDAALAALYLQAQPDNSVAIKFADRLGYWHEAISAADAIQGFDWGSDPTGSTGRWYQMAATCDGSTLSLYLNDIVTGDGFQLMTQTDMTASGSPDTALTNGSNGNPISGGDWNAGVWSVGRGLYNGGHADRAYGFLDEIRISDVALAPQDFLTIEYAAPMSLVVNTTTGETAIRNNTDAPISFDYYIIQTDSSTLDPTDGTGWNSLSDQNLDAVTLSADFNEDGMVDGNDLTDPTVGWQARFGADLDGHDFLEWQLQLGQTGGGVGMQWEEAGGSDASQLAELFLNGATTIAAGESISIGNAFAGTGEDPTLSFSFGIQGRLGLVVGDVEFVSGAMAAIPEPASICLAIVAMTLLLVGRARRPDPSS